MWRAGGIRHGDLGCRSPQRSATHHARGVFHHQVAAADGDGSAELRHNVAAEGRAADGRFRAVEQQHRGAIPNVVAYV
jgi:hypothetical protein